MPKPKPADSTDWETSTNARVILDAVKDILTVIDKLPYVSVAAGVLSRILAIRDVRDPFLSHRLESLTIVPVGNERAQRRMEEDLEERRGCARTRAALHQQPPVGLCYARRHQGRLQETRGGDAVHPRGPRRVPEYELHRTSVEAAPV